MSAPRLFHPQSLAALRLCGLAFELSAAAARHVQVLRLQPTYTVTLFDGLGGEYTAQIQAMTRSTVSVLLSEHSETEREAKRDVALAICCPANDRMDWLVEKATELGVRAIYPVLSERVVLRLTGERADKRREHWHNIAIAACEQSGRNRLPTVHPLMKLQEVFGLQTTRQKLILSLADGSKPLWNMASEGGMPPSLILCGPEGGLSAAEEALALQHGFAPVSLANRVLRSETAALAALSSLACR